VTKGKWKNIWYQHSQAKNIPPKFQNLKDKQQRRKFNHSHRSSKILRPTRKFHTETNSRELNMVAKCLLQLCLALGGLVLGLLDLQHLLYNLLLLNQKCPNDPLPNCGTRQNTTIWTVHSPPVPWQPGPLVLSRSEVRNLQSKQVQYLWECPYCSHDNANATQTCEKLIS